MITEVGLHKASSPDDYRDDLNFFQVPCVSEVMLKVLLLVDLFSLSPVEPKIIGN